MIIMIHDNSSSSNNNNNDNSNSNSNSNSNTLSTNCRSRVAGCPPDPAEMLCRKRSRWNWDTADLRTVLRFWISEGLTQAES